MTKIALPTNDRKIIEQDFMIAKEFAIVTLDKETVQSVEFLESTPDKPGIVPGLLLRQGIDALVVGEINGITIRFMLGNKIDVAIGAAGELEAIAIEYQRGTLCSLLEEHSHDDQGCGGCSSHGTGSCGHHH